MDQLRIDTGDLQRLEATIDQAAGVAARDVAAVVKKGALNIKKDAQRRVGRGGHRGAYAATIGFDFKQNPTGASAEIGPDKDKQVGGGEHRTPGNLGALLEYEYGTPWSAPKPHLAPALEAEGPRFEAALEDVIVRALGL